MKSKLKQFIESRPDMKTPASEFRVSYAGSCLRKMDYDGMYGVPSLDEASFFRFELGHSVDQIFKTLLSEAFGADFHGMDTELKLTTPKGNTIVGHPDGRLVSRNAVVEIKSCAASTFDLVARSNQPLVEHFEQANLYAHALKAEVIIFIYFNKNSSNYIVLEKAYDLGQAIYNLEKFDLAAENRLNKVISPRTYQDETASPCYYCGHRERCYADFKKDHEAMAVDKTITDPIVVSFTKLFHDARKLRLDTEKLEDTYEKGVVLALANDQMAKEAVVRGDDRMFSVKIKPATKNKKYTLSVKELSDEQSNNED